MKFIKDLTLIGIGVILMAFLPDKQKMNLQKENQSLKLSVQNLKKEKPQSEGGLTILPKNSKSLTFKDFTGTITWYQSPNFENLPNGPADFQPIEQAIDIHGGIQTITIPSNANAVLRKNTGGVYKMEVDTGGFLF